MFIYKIFRKGKRSSVRYVFCQYTFRCNEKIESNTRVSFAKIYIKWFQIFFLKIKSESCKNRANTCIDICRCSKIFQNLLFNTFGIYIGSDMWRGWSLSNMQNFNSFSTIGLCHWCVLKKPKTRSLGNKNKQEYVQRSIHTFGVWSSKDHPWEDFRIVVLRLQHYRRWLFC